jgi:hypothetical protein
MSTQPQNEVAYKILLQSKGDYGVRAMALSGATVFIATFTTKRDAQAWIEGRPTLADRQVMGISWPGWGKTQGFA